MAAVLLALSFTPSRTPDSVLSGDSRLVLWRVTFTFSVPYLGFSAPKSFLEKTPQMCTALSRGPHISTLLDDTFLPAFFSDRVTRKITHSALLISLEFPLSPWSRSPNDYPTLGPSSLQGLLRAKRRVPLYLEFLLLLLQQICLQPLAY